MDTRRLANVIFDMGKKITQSQYSFICESIDDDRFTLDEYVVTYKLKESFMGNIPFKLADGTTVLVSESLVSSIKSVNIDSNTLVSFMSEEYGNFKKIISIIIENEQE